QPRVRPTLGIEPVNVAEVQFPNGAKRSSGLLSREIMLLRQSGCGIAKGNEVVDCPRPLPVIRHSVRRRHVFWRATLFIERIAACNEDIVHVRIGKAQSCGMKEHGFTDAGMAPTREYFIRDMFDLPTFPRIHWLGE